jgi:hypothetical protein
VAEETTTARQLNMDEEDCPIKQRRGSRLSSRKLIHRSGASDTKEADSCNASIKEQANVQNDNRHMKEACINKHMQRSDHNDKTTTKHQKPQTR